MAGFLPGGIGYGRPAGIPDTGGILSPQQSDQGGGIFGSYAPQAGGIFAALMDAGSRLSGSGSTDNFARYHAQNQDSQMRQQLLAGLSSSDPATQKQAAMYAAASGFDPSALLSIMRPKVEHVGEDLVSVDPFDPNNIQTLRKGEKAPPDGYSRNPDGTLGFIKGGPADPTQAGAISGARRQPPPGYTFAPDNQSLSYIPGGPADPRVAGTLAGSRRAPPKLGAAGPLGNPASLFGGR